MSIDEFWGVVERVHAASPNDMDAKCRLLADELRQLSPAEVQSFEDHFTDCYYELDNWDVSGAAHVINDGCGDDSFMDFRSTLISLGHAPFRAALVDSDSLVDFDIDPKWARYEGYQYVAPEVYEKMTGNEVPRSKSHPKGTKGVRFNEWEMTPRFPKLVAKYGYKDSAWLVGKERMEKGASDDKAADKLISLMLEAGIVSSCGLVPPPRIVAQVLRTGLAPALTNRQYTWEPYELDERHYWIAVWRLSSIPPAELQSRPELLGVKISSDVGASGANNFDGWMQTLKARGLV